jgi:hypothetical protein
MLSPQCLVSGAFSKRPVRHPLIARRPGFPYNDVFCREDRPQSLHSEDKSKRKGVLFWLISCWRLSLILARHILGKRCQLRLKDGCLGVRSTQDLANAQRNVHRTSLFTVYDHVFICYNRPSQGLPQPILRYHREHSHHLVRRYS